MSSRCTSSPVRKKIFLIFTTSYFACLAQVSPLKIRHGKSTIEFADFFTITNLQMRTNEEIEKKKFNRSFAQFTFRRRVQKYWNLLPLETRNLGIEGFKTEIKTIMTDDNRARLRQKLLNFGLSQPIELPPAGINKSWKENWNTKI